MAGTPSRTLLLGIDTGGTYTDAVVYDEEHRTVVATAKAPTTHHDLAVGIGAAIDAALSDAAVDPSHIELVSLSTTLATNALVEGGGRPVCAVVIGFDDAVAERGGLAEALAGDPAVFLRGGHDPHGAALEPLDLATLDARLDEISPVVDAFAVTSQFSVRNPEHEVAAAELIHRRTGRPVTCSHQLSARLNGPKRAVTAVLNARLIAIIDELVATTERTLLEHDVTAPLMVVRGDGSLVSAAFVRDRPIETILSGPAASLVGAAHLTGTTDAMIADIGGTTTDIAVLRAGVPIISDEGASVGGHRTMVSAVAMSTHGLGGDSHVRHDSRAAGLVMQIGPRRVVPLGLLATRRPELVHSVLQRQLGAPTVSELDGQIVVVDDLERALSELTGTELDVVRSMNGDAAAVDAIATSMTVRRVVDRLVRRRVLSLAAFTPTDASLVLAHDAAMPGDRIAARMGASLLARQRDRIGRAVAPDADAVAEATIAALVRRSGEAVLAAAFAQDGLPDGTAHLPVVQAALDRRLVVASVRVGLSAPLIALGASAGTYYPSVGQLLGAEVIVPEHAAVANAIGAVVGRVRITFECTVSSPQHGLYVAHTGTDPAPFVSLDDAVAHATAHLRERLTVEMFAAGAHVFEESTSFAEQVVEVSGTPMFVEGVLTMTGSGRPDLGR